MLACNHAARRGIAIGLALTLLGIGRFAAAEGLILNDAGEAIALSEQVDYDGATVNQSRWSGRIGAAILQRGRLKSDSFIYNANTGDTLLNSRGFDFPMRGGVDVGVMRRGEWADVDFRYFGIDQWNATQPGFTSGPGATLHFQNIAPSPDPVTIGTTTYGSELHSAEINFRRNATQWLTLLAGFRYLSFHEDFHLGADVGGGIPPVSIVMNTQNRLYGAQIGADAILLEFNRFQIESAIKTGVYGNAAGNSVVESIAGIGNIIDASGSRAHTAFVGDLNFTGVYQLNNAWSVRAGYQLLWLSGVALVADQPPGIDFNSGTDVVDTSGSAFFHGVLVGLERSW